MTGRDLCGGIELGTQAYSKIQPLGYLNLAQCLFPSAFTKTAPRQTRFFNVRTAKYGSTLMYFDVLFMYFNVLSKYFEGLDSL